MSKNVVVLHGRLVRDVELNRTQNDKAYARFTLAVDRDFKSAGGDRITDFVDCIAWGKTAEIIQKYFRQGSEAVVEGSLQTGSYTDRNGNKRKSVDVNVVSFDFCGSKKDNAQSAPAAPAPAPAEFSELPDDDVLPF